MNPFDTLESIYNGVADAVGDTSEAVFDSIDELASEIIESFDEGLDQFSSVVQNLLQSDPSNLSVVNETLAALLKAVINAGVDIDNRLRELLKAWLENLPELTASTLLSFLEIWFDLMQSQANSMIRVIRQLLEVLPDAEASLDSIYKYAAEHISSLQNLTQYALLPLFTAGLPVFGPEKLAKFFLSLLKDNSSVYQDVLGLDTVGVPTNNPVLSSLYEGDVFKFRSIETCIISVLEGARSGSALPLNGYTSNPGLNFIFEPASDYFSNILNSYFQSFQSLFLEFIQFLIRLAEGDRDAELLLLKLGRFSPLGVLFLLVGIVYKLITSPAPWTRFILNPIEDDPSLNVLRLDAPSSDRKYILLSDIHRDAKSDQNPPFQFGSIDHFMNNAELYLDLLKHYEKEGYTIIENGDCEELWFFRDFSLSPVDKIKEIIDTHDEIYALLSELHQKGRYFRNYGNHDSYLRDQDVFEILNNAMDPNGDSPFQIYDFIIIDGVKTMWDVPFALGLDSEPNTELKPLIITHGHQWDFWNCDENSILGKLIVTAVVTPLDLLDDPIRDIAGISQSGSPLVNFKSILADLLVFNSWPNYDPAVSNADKIQHMEDMDRRLVDDIQYSETLTSLMSGLILVRNGVNGHLYETMKCFDDYSLFNLLCIGHTHNPQNEPYHDLKQLPIIGDLLNTIAETVEAASFGLMDSEDQFLVKSNFLNSGTSGWFENTIWAIDLGNVSHCTGQPKLVYWAHNTKVDTPNEMNWELPHLKRDGVNDPGSQLDAFRGDLLARLEALAEYLKKSGESSQLSGTPTVGIQDAIGFLKGNIQNFEIAYSQVLSAMDLSQVTQLLLIYVSTVLSACERAVDTIISIRIHLPKQFAQAIREVTAKSPLSDPNSQTKAIAQAVAWKATESGAILHGLNRNARLQANEDKEAAYLTFLNLLLSFSKAKNSPFSLKMRLKRNQLVAKLSIRKPRLSKHTAVKAKK